MNESSIMPEQISLFTREATDPVWSDRLTTDDESGTLGPTFVLNSLLTPSPVPWTRLVAPAAIEAAGGQLAGITDHGDTPLVVSRSTGRRDAPAAWDLADLGRVLGLDLGDLPGAYRDWRFSTELYVVTGGAVYLVQDTTAVRHRVLTDDEVELTYVRRLLPFRTDDPDRLTGVLFLCVGVPARLAALGGVRGYRRALLEAGRAVQWLAERSDRVSWRWDSEFYDDVACRLLGVDGLERVVTHVGYQRIDDQEPLDD